MRHARRQAWSAVAWAAALALGAGGTHAAGTLEPDALLAASDRARGGGLPGIVWDVRLRSREQGRSDERELTVKATQTSSLAEVVAPARFKGSKLLQVDRNMWLSRPGLRKPVPISARQKLSGQAAQGDIASTNYVVDYEAELRGEERVGAEDCYVLDLKARNRAVTYDRVVYWISKRRLVGVRAEFRSVSGKLLKSAEFEYDNEISFKGQAYPFVSRMVIRDALSPDDQTTLSYSSVKVQGLAPQEFELSRLGE